MAHLGSLTEQNRLARSTQVESKLSGTRHNTAFVGNISEGITDETMERILNCCGPVAKWKRVLDASNMPKSFGFCEFASADALNRALILLLDLPLLGAKRLNVKVDDSTKEYLTRFQEALSADQVEMTSKEADLLAIDSLVAIIKEKNYPAALEALEKKRSLLTAEAPEEGEALSDDIESTEKEPHWDSRSSSTEKEIDSHYGNISGGGKRREFRDNTRSKESLTYAFKDREARWESREAQQSQRRRRNEQLEIDRVEQQNKEKEYALNYLNSFDDFDWMIMALDKLCGINREINVDGRVPDFYINRELWKSRRVKDREREEEYDRREEEAEDRRSSAATAPTEIENHATNNIQEKGKKSRPTAAQFIEDKTPELETKKSRKPLIERDFTKEELLNSGYTETEAMVKLRHLHKEKILKLIETIPSEQEPLFEFQVEWKYLDPVKFISILKKKVSSLVEKYRRSSREFEMISQSLMVQIQQHSPPETIVEWLLEDGKLLNPRGSSKERRVEAECFVGILWRYLVFQTELAAYNLSQ